MVNLNKFLLWVVVSSFVALPARANSSYDLLSAIMQHDTYKVAQCLPQEDPNMRYQEGQTALMVAVQEYKKMVTSLDRRVESTMLKGLFQLGSGVLGTTVSTLFALMNVRMALSVHNASIMRPPTDDNKFKHTGIFRPLLTSLQNLYEDFKAAFPVFRPQIGLTAEERAREQRVMEMGEAVNVLADRAAQRIHVEVSPRSSQTTPARSSTGGTFVAGVFGLNEVIQASEAAVRTAGTETPAFREDADIITLQIARINIPEINALITDGNKLIKNDINPLVKTIRTITATSLAAAGVAGVYYGILRSFKGFHNMAIPARLVHAKNEIQAMRGVIQDLLSQETIDVLLANDKGETALSIVQQGIMENLKNKDVYDELVLLEQLIKARMAV